MAAIFLLTSSLSLSGCLSTPIPESDYDRATINETYKTQELSCLGDILKAQEVRKGELFSLAVGSIVDRTGKVDQFGAGHHVTQGAADIATTALFSTNAFRVNERVDVGVHKFEVDYAGQGFLREREYREEGVLKRALRKNSQGDVLGTDFYLAGAITEINYNIESGGYEADINGLEHGKRVFKMSIALDLRLVDTTSLEIIDAVSIKKVIKGYETKWGLFDFLDNRLIDINGGEKVQEPLQLGVRAAIEEGIMQLTSRLYNFNLLGDSYSCEKITGNIIRFDTNKYEKFHISYKPMLEDIANYLTLNKDVKVTVTGHADERGTEEYNNQLAENRAKRVKEYLIAMGIESERVIARGMGENVPYVGLVTPYYYHLDRRVEIKINNKRGLYE